MPTLEETIDLSQLPDQETPVVPDVGGVTQAVALPSGLDLSGLPDQAGASTLDPLTGKELPKISQGPEAPFMQPFWDILMSRDKPGSAKAAAAVGIAEQLDIQPSIAYDNFDVLSKQLGLRGVPTADEMLSTLFIPPIAMGVVTAPATAVFGLTAWQMFSEIESYAISLKKGLPYQMFQNRGLVDLLPEDAGQLTRDVVNVIDIVGKGLAIGAGFKQAPKLMERITKNVVDTYNLPREVYIDAAKLKAELQTGGILEKDVMDLYKGAGLTGAQAREAVKNGVTLKIPVEKITTWQDKPWYGAVKKMLSITPYQKTTVTRAGEVTAGRPIAGLLTQEPTRTAPRGGPVAQTAEEAAAAIQAAPEATDTQIGAIFDNVTGTAEIPSEPVPAIRSTAPEATIPEILSVVPEPAPVTPEALQAQETHARLVEEAVKFVVDKTPALLPDMIDRAVAAGYDRENVQTFADEYVAMLRETEQRATDLKNILGNERGAVNPALLIDLGRAVWNEGHQTYEQFTSRMKETLRGVWERVKDVMQKVWEHVKRVIGNERGAIGPDKKAKTRIRALTGQTQLTPLVSERAALAAGMKKAEQAGEAGYKSGVQAGLEQAATPKPETLKATIERTGGRAKDVAPPISELAQLKAAYIMSARAAREAFRAGNKEGVATENARMKEILGRAKDTKEARAIVSKGIKTAKKIQEKSLGKIAIDYQEKIKALFEGIDFAKPTEATIERLQSLSEFIGREGVPLGISQAELNQLNRLSKTPFRELSGTFQAEILKTAERLYDLGALKQELQQNEAGRQMAKELDALVRSTTNLDPTLSGEKQRTQADNLKLGVLQADLSSLHTFRIADRLDGSKDYAGENARLIKEQIRSEVEAKSQAQTRINRVVDKIKALGLTELTPEMAQRINVVLMAEQGARGQVTALLDKYGMDSVPTLSTQERAVLTALRDEAGAKTAEIKAVYEKRENLPFPAVKNYFPIAYERDQFDSPLDAVDPNRYRTRQVAQGFTKLRKPGVEESPRDDLFKILDNAILNQEWYIQMQPVLDHQAELIRTPEFKDAAGDQFWNWWKDQIDIVARKGWTANAVHQAALRDIRMNLNTAVLGFKISSALMQPFAVFDAMAYAGSHYGLRASGTVLLETMKAWAKLQQTRRYAQATPELRLRQAGEIAVEETMQRVKGVAGVKARLVEASMAPLRFADIVTAAGSERSFIKILIREGWTPAAAKQEAAFLMELVSGSSMITARPHILASGELWRTILTFQTFFLNRWGIVSHDIIRTGAKGSWKRKALALMGLSILVAGGMSEQEAKKIIYEQTTGEKSKQPDESFIKAILLYLPRQAPVIGALFQGQSVEPPTLRVAKQAAQGAGQVAEGKPISGFEKLAEAILTAFVGLPGTAQMFDILDNAISDIKKEEADQAKRRKSP